MFDIICFVGSEWKLHMGTAAVKCLRGKGFLQCYYRFSTVCQQDWCLNYCKLNSIKKKFVCCWFHTNCTLYTKRNTVNLLQSSMSVAADKHMPPANTGKELHKHVLLCFHARHCSCPYFFMKSSIAAPWQTERISWHGSAPLSVSSLLFTVQTHLPFTHKWLLRVVQR